MPSCGAILTCLVAFAAADVHGQGGLDQRGQLRGSTGSGGNATSTTWTTTVTAILSSQDVQGVPELQLQALASSQNALIPKINALIRSQLGMVNRELAGALRRKDPMPLRVREGPVTFTRLAGISSLHISSLKVVRFALPKITFSARGYFRRTLKIDGYASGAIGRVPVSVYMQHVGFSAPHIVAQVNAKTFAITRFSASGTRVGVGSTYAHIHCWNRVFVRIADHLVNKCLRHKKRLIEGKISGMANGQLTHVLNTKVKGVVNAKIKSIMGSKKR